MGIAPTIKKQVTKEISHCNNVPICVILDKNVMGSLILDIVVPVGFAIGLTHTVKQEVPALQ
jgi:hypothetical protein